MRESLSPEKGIVMRVKRFEQYIKDLLIKDDHEEIVKVETFEEGGYTDKPAGVHIVFASKAEIWIQFVRASPPGGDDHSKPEYIITKEML